MRKLINAAVVATAITGLLLGMPGIANADGSGTVNTAGSALRSEERRVGKECRSRWSPYH